MNATTDFKEFAQRTAAELDACAKKGSCRASSSETYADECAASSSFGIVWMLRHTGIFKEKIDEEIANSIFEETTCFVHSNARPIAAIAMERIEEKLVSAVRFAKRGWFAQQAALSV